MKQEIWRFSDIDERRLRLVGGSEAGDAFCAFAYCDTFDLFRDPLIGGVSLKPVTGPAHNLSDAREKIAEEIRRQLATRGVKVEIRRVKR